MRPLRVEEVMHRGAHCCRVTDSCGHAAQMMWQHDCGALPIVDDRREVVGVITDRDICMGAYTKGCSVWEIPVTAVSSLRVHSVSPEDSVDFAEELMQRHRIRRLVVLDRGRNLVGMLSLADLVRRPQPLGQLEGALRGDRLASVFASCSRRDVAPPGDRRRDR
jgi:CBS-domain-containing membrane protein